MKKILFAAAFVLLLSQSAFAGVAPAPAAPLTAPAIAPWGMVGTAVAMGLSGLYFIIKRHK